MNTIIYVHTSDGTHIRHYVDSVNWEPITMTGSQSAIINSLEAIEDLSCHHITAKTLDIGSAHIVSVPTGAKIYIGDINYTGNTPALIDMPVGPHTYKLSYPGYAEIDGILFIELNTIYELSVIMEKMSWFDPTLLLLGAGVFMVWMSGRKNKEPKYDRYRFNNLNR
jgi:hypothetical protein